tara:strand:+ start:3106 stop:3843 length:738 start_codon:yes stop_codon:yes gene_type:complete
VTDAGGLLGARGPDGAVAGPRFAGGADAHGAHLGEDVGTLHADHEAGLAVHEDLPGALVEWRQIADPLDEGLAGVAVDARVGADLGGELDGPAGEHRGGAVDLLGAEALAIAAEEHGQRGRLASGHVGVAAEGVEGSLLALERVEAPGIADATAAARGVGAGHDVTAAVARLGRRAEVGTEVRGEIGREGHVDQPGAHVGGRLVVEPAAAKAADEEHEEDGGDGTSWHGETHRALPSASRVPGGL